MDVCVWCSCLMCGWFVCFLFLVVYCMINVFFFAVVVAGAGCGGGGVFVLFILIALRESWRRQCWTQFAQSGRHAVDVAIIDLPYDIALVHWARDAAHKSGHPKEDVDGSF